MGAALGLMLALFQLVEAKAFRCGGGDVPCLIDAIKAANANGGKNTIRLEAGTYTLPGGALPSVTSTLTITGAGADTTSIERAFVDVAVPGTLTLKRLTIRRGGSTTWGV